LKTHNVFVRQGLRFLRLELPGILATQTDVLSPRMSRLIGTPPRGSRGCHRHD
jgi:hypothetical protein